MSKERPLLVSSALIGPILRGEKTVTRRLIRWPTVRTDTDRATIHGPDQGLREPWPYWHHNGNETPIKAPCAVGDVLWVRETWAHATLLGSPITVYNAEDNRTDYGGPWRPSIHMKHADARIFLRVEDVRVERVQDITEEDARAEGIDFNPNAGGFYGNGFVTARAAFADLWDSLAPAGSKWADSPWVWVIRFKSEVPRG